MNTFHLGVIVHVRHYTYTELTSSQNVSMLCKVHEAMQTQSTFTGQAFTLCSCSFLCEWYNFSSVTTKKASFTIISLSTPAGPLISPGVTHALPLDSRHSLTGCVLTLWIEMLNRRETAKSYR